MTSPESPPQQIPSMCAVHAALACLLSCVARLQQRALVRFRLPASHAAVVPTTVHNTLWVDSA